MLITVQAEEVAAGGKPAASAKAPVAAASGKPAQSASSSRPVIRCQATSGTSAVAAASQKRASWTGRGASPEIPSTPAEAKVQSPMVPSTATQDLPATPAGAAPGCLVPEDCWQTRTAARLSHMSRPPHPSVSLLAGASDSPCYSPTQQPGSGSSRSADGAWRPTRSRLEVSNMDGNSGVTVRLDMEARLSAILAAEERKRKEKEDGQWRAAESILQELAQVVPGFHRLTVEQKQALAFAALDERYNN